MMAVTLYRQVGKGKTRRYQKVNPGKGRRPADIAVRVVAAVWTIITDRLQYRLTLSTHT